MNVFNCDFTEGSIPDYSSEDCDNKIPFAELTREIFIDSCRFSKELGITNLVSRTYAGQLKLNNDSASYLDLRSSKLKLATINADDFANSVNFSYNHIDLAIIGFIRAKNPKAYFSSIFSYYKTGIQLIDNDLSDSGFQTDTLLGYFHYLANNVSKTVVNNRQRNLMFNNCFINADIEIKIADSLFIRKLRFTIVLRKPGDYIQYQRGYS